MNKNKYLFTVMTLLMLLLIVFLIFEKNDRIEVLKNKTIEQHKSQINSFINQYKKSNKFIFNSIINNDEILLLQKKALIAKDKNEKDKYRKLLYKKLSNFYEHLRDYGIKQLHFHLPTNESFLRFHKPSKFGDNLTSIRTSIVKVNENLQEINGFEEGRIFNGYRFVYPLFYQNEHIGSVEISIGFNVINTISLANYNIFQYMILNKDIVEGKLFSGEKKNYEQSEVNENFFHEVNTFSNYQDAFSRTEETLSKNVFDKLNFKLSEKFDTKYFLEYTNKVEFFSVNGKYYYISLLPIKNIKQENIGYIISYKRCECVRGILEEFYIKIFLIVLLFAILFLFLHKREVSKRQLEKLNKIANEQRDNAVKAAKVKAEFLANMSHEIRTPLNGILGFVELLEENITEKKNKEYLEIINNSSHHLMGVIDDVLDFSKIESGKLHIDLHDFDSRKEFQGIRNLFEAKSSQKNISLHLNIDKNVPEILHSDPLRIKQVISNLLSNAIKFTGDGKNIYIDISYSNNIIKISVQDEGIGIASDKLKYIFEAFNQEDTSTTRQYGGTGLGLSTSMELVSLLGGMLNVKSTLGKGSEFYFTIPMREGTSKNKSFDTLEHISFENKKVLLVEDNKSNQLFMSVILKKMNLEFDIAVNGLDAVNMFKKNSYDLILMDENMPIMNGIEATKKIVEFEKEEKIPHTPIVALTANALKTDRERFLSSGMDEYLSKPLDRIALNKVLQKLL